MLKNKAGEEKIDTLLSKSQIPIIDLAHCGTEECPIRSVVNRVGHQLHKALAEKGIALLVNHGISEDKMKHAYGHLDDFCKLSDSTKETYLRQGETNHGYIKPGQERFDGKTKDLRHTYNICTLKPEDGALPDEPLPGFREHMSDLATDFKRLSALLLQALAVGMELPYSYFVEKHRHILDGEGENQSTFRLLYYPPLIEDDGKNELLRGTCKYSQQRCTKDEIDLSLPEDYRARVREEQEALEQQEQQVTRCGAHADYGTFTLLAQDSEGGLEVKLPGTDRWKRVGHLPGAILINAGELLATWTGEKISALQHRVIIPNEESIRTRGRHSLAFFVHPDNCISITPIDLPASSSSNSLDTDEKKAKGRKKSFKTAKSKIYNAYQHVQRRFKETYAS
uniref:Putative iron/ascorbate family oxidoreductase n=1 Tax=Anopheles triannulatus TaxID=58253 RepID=A0A2M4AHD9_9DIPT